MTIFENHFHNCAASLL